MTLRPNKLGGLVAVEGSGFVPAGPVYGTSVFQIPGGANPICGVSGVAKEAVVRFGRYETGVLAAKRQALSALAEQAKEMGGHGVVSVTLGGEWLPLGSTAPSYKVTAAGTAVVHHGSPVAAPPFISAVSGADFAKLIAAGLVPVGVVLGFAAFHVHGWATTAWSNNASYKNAEMPALTRAVTQARAEARRQLVADLASLGAETAVAATLEVSTGGATDQQNGCRNIFATAIGAGVSRFGPPSNDGVDVRMPLSR